MILGFEPLSRDARRLFIYSTLILADLSIVRTQTTLLRTAYFAWNCKFSLVKNTHTQNCVAKKKKRCAFYLSCFVGILSLKTSIFNNKNKIQILLVVTPLLLISSHFLTLHVWFICLYIFVATVNFLLQWWEISDYLLKSNWKNLFVTLIRFRQSWRTMAPLALWLK